MYQVILLKNGILQINNFKTQAEAYNFISEIQPQKYKIYNSNQRRKLDLINSYYWNEHQQDFVINIDLAKEIIKNKFREIRSILFDKLDKAFMKALEQDDAERKACIINLKNQFRNITEIPLPDTEEELINFIPPVFKEVYDLTI